MPCPSNDVYYAPLFKSRNVGAEDYYLKGAVKLAPDKWIHCYIDNNGHKRITLTVKGVVVSGLQVNRQDMITKRATLSEYQGNKYSNILQGLAPIYFGFQCYASPHQTQAGKACYKIEK